MNDPQITVGSITFNPAAPKVNRPGLFKSPVIAGTARQFLLKADSEHEVRRAIDRILSAEEETLP